MLNQLLDILNKTVSTKLYALIVGIILSALITSVTTTIVDHLVLKPEIRILHAPCIPTNKQIKQHKKYFKVIKSSWDGQGF